ncbi:MAG: ribosome small subunit-dependent GTPase A [Balneolaceae bacterium]
MALTGKVIESTGKWYKVEANGEVTSCRLPGRFRLNSAEVTNPVTVGDRVDISIGDDQTGIITHIHDRDNFLPRQATHGRRGEQILAANIDRAWAVVSVRQPALKTGFLDRFLVACEAYGIPASILINKTDLASKRDWKQLEALRELYSGLGYPVHVASIHNSESIEELKTALDGHTNVFIGPSGVGKTSLLNCLKPGADLTVGDISGYSNKGKHTTTVARLLRIGDAGYIVDTPGIRELGLVNIEPYELSLYYPEMLKPRENCKFNNCTHSHEPGCGVSAAFEAGEIHPERYFSYLNILESL